MPTIPHRILRALGPVLPPGSPMEALRAGLGACLALALLALILPPGAADLRFGLYLIAPFGASAVLVFAVPSSPLAQPWSVVMGNGVSALVAVVLSHLLPPGAMLVALALGAAVAAMILSRALHPPGGAVALTAALSPEAMQHLGLWFVLVPVLLGSALLVALAVLWARATGRHYPFRQFAAPQAHGTTDPPPPERLGLTEAELTGILERYRQSLNLGVEDLARLIAAAELEAASHRSLPVLVGAFMSRDLVTLPPEAPLRAVAASFARHGFGTMPVMGQGGRYLGLIAQSRLLTALTAGHAPWAQPKASSLMQTATPVARADMPIAALLPLLAEGTCDAVPVLEGARLIGIVTRSDLIAALARESLRKA